MKIIRDRMWRLCIWCFNTRKYWDYNEETKDQNLQGRFGKNQRELPDKKNYNNRKAGTPPSKEVLRVPLYLRQWWNRKIRKFIQKERFSLFWLLRRRVISLLPSSLAFELPERKDKVRWHMGAIPSPLYWWDDSGERGFSLWASWSPNSELQNKADFNTTQWG